MQRKMSHRDREKEGDDEYKRDDSKIRGRAKKRREENREEGGDGGQGARREEGDVKGWEGVRGEERGREKEKGPGVSVVFFLSCCV